MTTNRSRFNEKLPIAPQPNSRESLGGWYARVSLGYAVKFHGALPVLDLGHNGGVFVDNTMIANISKKLSKITDIPPRVWKKLIEPEAKLTNMWLKYQPETEYCFPQLPNYYCVDCFLEDLETRGQTFYRVDWMSPFILSCYKHGSPLTNNKLSAYDNSNCKLDLDKFESRVSYAGNFEIVNREITQFRGNLITPMARRVSDLFSLDSRVSKSALKTLGRHDNLEHARSAAIAVLQILSFRSWQTNFQCVGRLLFAESNCREFVEGRKYNRRSLCYMTKRQLLPCFEQVGWFICHPRKYLRYGLSEYTNFVVSEFKSDKLLGKIKEDQLVLLFALLVYYQEYNFFPEIALFHPRFEREWRRASKGFFDSVDKNYVRQRFNIV